MQRFLIVLFCLTAWGPCLTQPSGHAKRVDQFHVYGYHTYWMKEAWKDYDFSLIHTLFFFDVQVEPNGTFGATNGWPGVWEEMLETTRSRGTRIIPTLTLFGPQAFEALFTREDAIESLIENAVSAARMAEADGLHIDFEVFEPVSDEARSGFSHFIARLDEALKDWDPVAELVVFVPAFDQADAFDEKAIAASSDHLLVQGYDLHWLNAPNAGPVAPIEGWQGLNWGAILDRYLALDIPREKLVFSIPLYGYEWPTTSAELGADTRGPGEIIRYSHVDSLTSKRATALERSTRYGARRDQGSGSPFYIYQGEDGWYQGWYEDSESLAAKYRFIIEHQLGGVALFALGYDRGELLDLLAEQP